MMALLGVLGGAFKVVAAWLGFMQRRADQKAGAVAQAAVETQQAAQVETSIAQAEADSAKTQAAVVNALNSGTF